MSWNNVLERWRDPAALAPETSGGDEIDEELMYHVRALVDDNIARGMSADEAWRAAQQRFGSLRRYSEACRHVSLGHRLLWQRLPMLGIVVLGAFVVWLLFEVQSLRHAQRTASQRALAALSQAHNQAIAATEAKGFTDLVGRVTGPDDEPIAGADVLVIRKTWPGGRYRQEDFATKTDDQGRFRLPKLVPSQGNFAFQVAVIKDGFGLASKYQLIRQGQESAFDAIELKLEPADAITLVIHAATGEPAANARVVPSSRRTVDGDEYLVYFQGSEPIQTASDAEGRVQLKCFKRGDRAQVYVRVPGGDWIRHAIKIPREGNVIDITTEPAPDEVRPTSY